MWDVSTTIALIGSAGVFAYLYINADEEQKLIKFLFLFPALIFCFSAVAMQEDVINSQTPTSNTTVLAAIQSNYEVQLWVFRLTLAFIIFAILFQIIMAFVRQGKMKREADGIEGYD